MALDHEREKMCACVRGKSSENAVDEESWSSFRNRHQVPATENKR